MTRHQALVADRWRSIGRTRRKLAEILTTHPKAAALGAHVLPEEIYDLRLVGLARLWEDAATWSAYVTTGKGTSIASLSSYDSMTAIVRAGGISWVGSGGECVARPRHVPLLTWREEQTAMIARSQGDE